MSASQDTWQTIAKLWAPLPKLSLSEWAEKYGRLSAETSAESGRFRAYPFQVGILDAVTDPTIERVTVMKSRRVGYTKIINFAVGYSIHQDPDPILVIQPTVDDAKEYGKEELEPMFRDIPEVGRLVSKRNTRNIENTLHRKRFPRGSLMLGGASAPRGFRRVTAKRVFFDEVDGYPVKGAGAEGDQIALGIGRADTYSLSRGRKIVLGSTPTIKGVSRIERSYQQSDQRRYFVPCPHCEHMQVLVWERMHWIEGKPETVAYRCEECEALIEHQHKRKMVERGEWRATAPFTGHAGFHIWAAYSYSPQAAWPNLVKEYEDAKGSPLQMQVFINQLIGETFEAEGERPDEGSLQARQEKWEGVPEEVLFTTVGVDTQDDRLELELVGWGMNEESWSLDYRVILGDPATDAVWADLDRYLISKAPAAVCIDSGGHHTQAVYAFCRDRFNRRVHAIKGMAGPGRNVWPQRATKLKRGGNLFIIGVDAAKDSVYARLRLTKPGPGYCHFPNDREDDWFSGITSETVIVQYHKSFPVRAYQRRPGLRNEPLDCRVYAFAALCSLNVSNWTLLQKQIADKRKKEREEAQKLQSGTPAPRPAPRRSNWVTSYRQR